MSRIGKLPIIVNNGVVIRQMPNNMIEVTGVKGSLMTQFSPEVEIALLGNKLTVTPVNDSISARAKWGLTRKLLANMCEGVERGFSKKLEVTGVGFKAEVVSSKLLKLTLGYSHTIYLAIPADLVVSCDKPTNITISGCDKQKVGQLAADICRLRKPEPYKGKGVRVEGQFVRKKISKKK